MFKNKILLITGGTGYIGSHTTIELLNQGHEVIIIDNFYNSHPDQDSEHQIQRIKHYRSLMPMAMEARKPMFSLSSADGAIGAHQTNVQQCYGDFSALTQAIAARVGLKPSI